MYRSFRASVAEARRRGDLYFAAPVDRHIISEAFGEANSLWRSLIDTLAVAVWMILSQCLSPDHSCHEAEGRLSKSPHRVWNKLQMHLLAYNVVRRAMALAALDGKSPALANLLQECVADAQRLPAGAATHDAVGLSLPDAGRRRRRALHRQPTRSF